MFPFTYAEFVVNFLLAIANRNAYCVHFIFTFFSIYEVSQHFNSFIASPTKKKDQSSVGQNQQGQMKGLAAGR